MTLDQFIKDNLGVPGVGDTPENRGQCVGLIENWTDALGLAHSWGNAADLIANADPNQFVKVFNAPDNYPAPGDILCFNWPPYGHTGVVTRADTNTFTLFEQNNPTGHAPRLHDYPNYSGVIGWLHPKVLDATNVGGDEAMSPDQERQAYEIILGREPEGPADGRTAWQFIQDARGELDAHRASDAMLVSQLGDAKNQAQQQQAQLDKAEAAINNLLQSNKALTDANDELQAELAKQVQPSPVLTPGTITGQADTPASPAGPSQPSNSPQVNQGNFSMNKYNKSLVALVGVAVQVATQVVGVHNPVLVAAIALLTALGVYSVTNTQ